MAVGITSYGIAGRPTPAKIPGLAAGDSAELQKVTAQVEALRKEWHTLDRQHAKLSEVLTNKRATGQPVIGEQSQMAKIRQAQGKVAVAA